MESLQQVELILKEKCRELGYEIVTFRFAAKASTLEIVIDRDEPISMDDITSVSQVISELLDEHDFTEKAYTLDISSLGAEKPIAIDKLEKYVGKYVNLHLSNAYKGLNTIEGDLDSVDGDEVHISYKDKTRLIKVTINKKDIDKARLAIKF